MNIMSKKTIYKYLDIYFTQKCLLKPIQGPNDNILHKIMSIK